MGKADRNAAEGFRWVAIVPALGVVYAVTLLLMSLVNSVGWPSDVEQIAIRDVLAAAGAATFVCAGALIAPRMRALVAAGLAVLPVVEGGRFAIGVFDARTVATFATIRMDEWSTITFGACEVAGAIVAATLTVRVLRGRGILSGAMAELRRTPRR